MFLNLCIVCQVFLKLYKKTGDMLLRGRICVGRNCKYDWKKLTLPSPHHVSVNIPNYDASTSHIAGLFSLEPIDF